MERGESQNSGVAWIVAIPPQAEGLCPSKYHYLYLITFTTFLFIQKQFANLGLVKIVEDLKENVSNEALEIQIKIFEEEGNINHPVPDARFEIRN